MTGPEAIEIVRVAALRSTWLVTRHAFERMRERNAELADLVHAVVHASRIGLQENGRWKISGTDLDGDDLVVVVVIDGDVVVVTLF